ncbi:MAG: hypothetical protein M0P31_15370 [Solirubrobacteraceae bacterium]|nr:hypothetical protein [Solirubrobacteraceae bacterium]
MATMTDRALDLLGPIPDLAESHGATDALLALLDGLGAGERPLWELWEDPGTAVALRPETVDTVWIPWLARVVGARLPGWMSETERRLEVRSPSGWRRGGEDQLIEAARRYMPGPDQRVTVRRRYDPDNPGIDSPGHVLVRSRLSDIDPGLITGLRAGTNMAPNPRAAVNTAGTASGASGGMLSVALTRVACAWNPDAEWCFRVTGQQPNDTASRGLYFYPDGSSGGVNATPVDPATDYRVRARVTTVDPSVPTAASLGLRWTINWYDAGGILISPTSLPVQVADEGLSNFLLEGVTTSPANAAYGLFYVGMITGGAGSANDVLTYECTRVRIAPADEDAAGYLDGDQPGGSWAGTPHNSTSTRADTRDSPVVRRAIAREIPFGFLGHVEIADGQIYDDLRDAHADYDALASAYTDYDDVRDS